MNEVKGSVNTPQKANKALDKRDLNKMFGRALMYGGSWNYERMQNLGFLYMMIPALKKIYKKDDKAEVSQAMKRHLEFFNTNQTAAPFIAGVTAAMEEKQKNKGAEAISGLKVGLMGPLAGLGDSLIWLTLVPICFSLGASYAKNGSVLGVIIALFLVNVINISLKYFGLRFGYNAGSDFIRQAQQEGQMERITNMAVGLGLVLVGGLAAQMVTVNFALTFTQGKLTVSLQKVLDGIIPAMVPMAVTLWMTKLLRKGRNPVVLIFATMIVSILLVWAGILK
ncbi:PTS system mannose/fructose/sorbose family transporter subunit IID [Schleiferilactobacillus perolens]|uniref:Pts system mannose-specific iid component n=1 Tax=Schleiferilactobacillus perolens DSM 12744 TaxID=1423792 RepID=A0A0R1N2H0_9LACO|nr:PTS system mannose/fructose/sorbose family transporter subunit IID [Schleiferilactobacillus perolens]KRL14414.1 pts system mannose-specific iid component [Schleiferilactobacillus perolens DSM 12744]